MKKRSDYRGEWFYENDTLRFVNHEEGRAVTEGAWGASPQILPDPEMTSASNYLAVLGPDATLSAITPGGQSYLKVVSNQATGNPGFFTQFIRIVPGRTYTLRVKGYTTSGIGSLYVVGSGNASGIILRSGAELPQGAANEGWVESTFTMSLAMSRLQLGVKWKSGMSVGSEMYVNAMELYEYNGGHGNQVFAQSGYTYQYHLKDHLGNVRMTFTTKDEKEESIANFEDASSDFLYYDEAVKINSKIFDHTDTTPGRTAPTHYSSRLNGTPNERYGVAKSLSVMPGDTINMQVFAKYLGTDTSTWTAEWKPFFESISQGGTPTTGTIIDGGLAGSTGGLLFPFWSLFMTPPPDNDDEDAPKAYLNWLIFDRDYNPKDGGAIQISTDAEEHGQEGEHEELSKQLSITEAGFVYVYLSNDNYAMTGERVEVYFDDFKVEHVKSPIVESQSFYPFGLTFGQFQQENSLINRFKFQGQEHQNELNLGWDSFKWRNHQPDIGRFFNVDKLAEKYYYNSPYAFSENKVVSHRELEGLEADLAIFAFQVAKAITSGSGTNILAAATGTQGLQRMQQGVTQEASAKVDMAVNGGSKVQEAVNNGESPQAVIQQNQQQQANGRGQWVAGAFEFGATQASMAAGFVGAGVAAPANGLNTQVNQATKVLQNAGEAPAKVVAAELPNGATTVATSGPVPTNIAPTLQNAANNIGGVGTVGQNGFTIGCCAEFHAGNQLLLSNPEFTPGAVKFSPAVTPRTGNVTPMCDNCKAIFGNN